jgi:putative NADH-flavin reductase
MRIFILGATGSIGRELIDSGLERGHRVTAFVRSPGKLAPRAGLDIVTGNPLETASIRAALPGHDVVFSAIGPRPPATFFKSSLMTDCAASTVAAMAETGVKRLLMVSAAFLFPGSGIAVSFVRWVLGAHGRDLTTMEALVAASDLEWTIARPSQLRKRRETHYRSEANALPANGFSVGIRAVASFMLDAAEQQRHVREIVGVSQ